MKEILMESHELYRKFRTAARLMRPNGRPHRAGPHGDGPHGPAADPTRGQGRILATLKLQDGIATKDLAFILGMRVASLNEALGKLEKAELITREAAEDDKRVMLIRLTDAGRATKQLSPERPDAFSSLSDDEREQLGGMLDRVIEQLEQQRAEQGLDAPDAEFDRWSEQARRRMGDDRFEHWMTRMAEFEPEKFDHLRRGFERRGPHGGGGGRGGHGPRGGYGRGRDHGFGGDFDQPRGGRGRARGPWGSGFDRDEFGPDARAHRRSGRGHGHGHGHGWAN